jgi:hypothetical protein
MPAMAPATADVREVADTLIRFIVGLLKRNEKWFFDLWIRFVA